MPIPLLQTSSNLLWLFAVFAVTWAVFFAYVFFVSRRQQELQSEIRELRHALERREAPIPDKSAKQGKSAWDAWWLWTPRLTTTLILWLIYVAYLMIRSYAPNPNKAAVYGAVMGIIGFADVIIVYFLVGNGTYTVLMVISFVSVWLYQKRIGYAGIQEVRESPVTPPVSVIVPAYNEENSILLTVDSLMALDYPDNHVVQNVDNQATAGVGGN